MIRASRLPRPRLKIFALSTSTKCPMTLMRPSKPLLKINFRLRLQIHRLFTKATFETLLASQPLAPVHLSVCTIHTWLRVSLLACKYSAFFFLQKNLVSSYSQGWPPWIRLLYSSIHFPFLSPFFSLRHGNVFAFFSFYAPLNKLFFCLLLYDWQLFLPFRAFSTMFNVIPTAGNWLNLFFAQQIVFGYQ